MKGNLLRIPGVRARALEIFQGGSLSPRDNNGSKSIFTRRGFFFRVSIFPTFPFDFFFSSRVCRTGGGAGGGASARVIVVRARWYSYRYNVIADTGKRGGRRLPPSPLPRAPRYIDLFSSFAYELFRFGSPGVYSRMKICSAAKYFSVVARLCSRARSSSSFYALHPIVYNACGSISFGTYLYTGVPRYLAGTCACVCVCVVVRACVRACMTARARNY